MGDYIQIAGVTPESVVDGPGLRAVVFSRVVPTVVRGVTIRRRGIPRGDSA